MVSGMEADPRSLVRNIVFLCLLPRISDQASFLTPSFRCEIVFREIAHARYTEVTEMYSLWVILLEGPLRRRDQLPSYAKVVWN
ncbi:hypothetical protein BRADI_4g07172v3 [Brachypodium distachyon]|uniref:Uncharacterized protein n=1 Tax=Brachypodium distachyon TaxID=15368 RepID=A0A2K2CKY4_BRADI|nr:hypothetical protein BRADI_4g07172v3 [Brachypodium distachyon]